MPPKYKRTHINLWDPDGTSELVISTSSNSVNFNKDISVDDIILKSFPSGINDKLGVIESVTESIDSTINDKIAIFQTDFSNQLLQIEERLVQKSNVLTKISPADTPKYVYNGVKGLNPISFNDTSIETRLSNLNFGKTETTQFMSKRMFEKDDWIWINRQTNRIWKILESDTQQPIFENDSVTTPKGYVLITDGVSQNLLSGKFQVEEVQNKVISLYTTDSSGNDSPRNDLPRLVSLIKLNGLQDTWIFNPPCFSINVCIENTNLLLSDPNTGKSLTNFTIGNEYTFDLSDSSLVSHNLLDINVNINNILVKQLTGVTYGVLGPQESAGDYIGYRYNSENISVSESTCEATMNYIHPGTIGSEITWFITENYTDILSQGVQWTVTIKNQESITNYSEQISINGTLVENDSTPFQIHESVAFNTAEKSQYFWIAQLNQWINNGNVKPILYDNVYDIPTRIIFDSISPSFTPNVILDVEPPESQTDFKILISMKMTTYIIGVSEYIGCFYMDPFLALPDSEQIDPDSRHHIPVTYKPFITIGICWKHQNDSEWTFDSKYKDKHILENVYKTEKGGAYHDPIIDSHDGEFYLSSKVIHLISNSQYSKSLTFQFDPPPGSSDKFQFCPYVEFMGMGLRLNSQEGDIQISSSIIF